MFLIKLNGVCVQECVNWHCANNTCKIKKKVRDVSDTSLCIDNCEKTLSFLALFLFESESG